MSYPHQPPRPGPQPGGFRPGPPPGGYRPSPPPAGQPPAGQPHLDQQPAGQQPAGQHAPAPSAPEHRPDAANGTGHPAVDAVLQSLANAAALAPGDQIAEYEAAHQVLQETLAGIDR
ncbi:hypothetical protein DMB66_55095 [Actinoplanes sp. ATCC 53533]|uniref:hypothetical protein n=1 Tax=Actinoplanes sp. ATCC 53533 TaxID=1288362 RepID=UPI000F787689|nr:hypothetical protein [Actinoplanes sp. ATCC 53533]RSM42138.1 hypothetical protein DMB66_55095 [Actinoplanes sp. ATCC 53533]